ncbi:MAG: hypothetical protein LC778_10205 [Acidobacteria bacterium]|nr:hypothetical protein [Acidobacteriota bacterium]
MAARRKSAKPVPVPEPEVLEDLEDPAELESEEIAEDMSPQRQLSVVTEEEADEESDEPNPDELMLDLIWRELGVELNQSALDLMLRVADFVRANRTSVVLRTAFFAESQDTEESDDDDDDEIDFEDESEDEIEEL